jgi:hypothetical protein
MCGYRSFFGFGRWCSRSTGRGSRRGGSWSGGSGTGGFRFRGLLGGNRFAMRNLGQIVHAGLSVAPFIIIFKDVYAFGSLKNIAMTFQCTFTLEASI